MATRVDDDQTLKSLKEFQENFKVFLNISRFVLEAVVAVRWSRSVNIFKNLL